MLNLIKPRLPRICAAVVVFALCSEYRFDDFLRTGWGISPCIYVLRLFAVYEIFYRCGRLGLCVRIYQNELYLHALGYYAFYVYRRGVARIQVLGKYVAARLGKSGKIRRQLQKNTELSMLLTVPATV